MAWQPQLWAGSTGAPISVSGQGIDAWPAQFGLPEHFFARNLRGFRKSFPARFALKHGRSPCPSQCGGPNLEGHDVKASTVTKPRDRANWQLLPGGCILKPQGWGGWALT